LFDITAHAQPGHRRTQSRRGASTCRRQLRCEVTAAVAAVARSSPPRRVSPRTAAGRRGPESSQGTIAHLAFRLQRRLSDARKPARRDATR
jgi:hypothetical protein